MRKLSRLEKERRGISNKEVVKLANRLNRGWGDVAETITKNDMLTKDAILRFDKAMKDIIRQVGGLSMMGGGNYIFRTDIGDTLESIENFFDERKVLKKAAMLNQMAKIEKRVR